MLNAGVDVGSLWTKAVVLRDGSIVGQSAQLTDEQPAASAEAALQAALAPAGATVADAATIVAQCFREVADLVVRRINEDQLFVFRRYDSVLFVHYRIIRVRYPACCSALCTLSTASGQSATIAPPPPAPVNLAPAAPACRASDTMRSSPGVDTSIAFNNP